jgi:hypothetical protein
MTSRVYTPDPTPAPKRIVEPGPPRPTTNEVSRAIAKWLIFCARLGLDTGSTTNLADVDWDKTDLAPFPGVVPDDLPASQVCFGNGACFLSFEDTVFWHVLSSDTDTYRTQTRGAKPFRGKILKRWEDLAQGVKPLLSAKLGIPQAELDPFRGSPSYRPPKVGTQGRRELWIDWRIWPDKPTRPDGLITIYETREGFRVQFDLETGRMEGISFLDPHLLKILRDVESKW